MADGEAMIVRPGGAAAFGLTPVERLRRSLARAGLSETATGEGAAMILRGDHIYGAGVIEALRVAPPATVLTDAEGRAVAARVDGESFGWARALLDAAPPARPDDHPARPRDARLLTATALAGRHDRKLRKRADPLLTPADDADRIERLLFSAAYKGVTDIVTKRVWPAPALAATRWCARTAITPNQVTWASAILAGLAFWLFWRGDFAAGLACAWAMTFLDTVDGKLARVTLSASRFGDVFDHGLDLIHPPFWWWAWIVGCAAAGAPVAHGGLALAIIVGGYVLQRGEEGLFLARFGIEMHVWRRFDSLFREVTARRNPNLLILTAAALAGAPAWGAWAVAGWVALSLLIHLARVAQAFAASRTGPVVSWLAAP